MTERLLLSVFGFFLALFVPTGWAAAQNQAPSVDAGPAQTIILPERSQAIGLQALVSHIFANPVFVTATPDTTGRLFVVEQNGRILIVNNAQVLPSPFLDIASKVSTGGERGLLGLAFHPQFSSNGRFFVNYTRVPDGATVIAEYHVSLNPNSAAPDERIFLVVPQPYGNHNGGMLAFGHDQLLYIGMGDGGSAGDPENRAQNRDELLGKVLRIDVDHDLPYSIPADNPFVGLPGKSEIFALGVRNPWRFSFDRDTGDLWGGDVGQNAWEEIDVITKGKNYGWRLLEGAHCFNPMTNCHTVPNLVAPVLEYAHEEGRCSVTGGYVYRGSQVSFLQGTYVFGDFCSGEIWGYQNGKTELLLDTAQRISSFGEDRAGELYVVGIEGQISQIISSTAPLDGTVTDLNGTVSDDGLPVPPGVLTTTWNQVAGPGTVTFADPAAVNTTASFSDTGTYVLRLTATDGALSTSADVTITVNNATTTNEPHDLNGDGTADLVWRNSLSGEVAGWLMNNATIASVGVVAGVSSEWEIEGMGDVDGDRQADIVWRHPSSGSVAVWLMNGLMIKSVGVPGGAATNWSIKGVGDVDNDGQADLVWRDTATGAVAIWLMNGLTIKQVGIPGTVPLNWTIDGVGDTNGDGKADLIWRHTTSGAVAIWLMNGLTITSVKIPGSTSVNWVITEIGDVDGNGTADIVWRNLTNGSVAIWLMNGLTIKQVGVPGSAATDWEIQ